MSENNKQLVTDALNAMEATFGNRSVHLAGRATFKGQQVTEISEDELRANPDEVLTFVNSGERIMLRELTMVRVTSVLVRGVGAER